MTEDQYEMHADEIARTIWDISTDNGRDIDEDLWDAHRANCHAAVANSYVDDISIDDWQAAALAKVGGAA